MIADDFISIKKALEELQKEEPKEQPAASTADRGGMWVFAEAVLKQSQQNANPQASNQATP